MKLTKAASLRIKELCQERNLTIYALAKNGGMEKNTLYQIEDCKDVKLTTIYEVCSTLGISLKTFFDSPFFDEIMD